ncbi:MAG: chorismate synthase [Clostridia bacterium]|nr:chorismate synthase [Clostridia bacterium]
MSSTFGNRMKISIFGQSHSAAIGVVMDTPPAGFQINMDELRAFLARRSPHSALSTARREPDEIEFLSGLLGNATCGAPLCAIIRNTDCRPEDYTYLADTPRPGHADYTAEMKYHGMQDKSGGGHFSGRLTAPLCIAGGICKQLLSAKGISLGVHLAKIGKAEDSPWSSLHVSKEDLDALDPFFPLNNEDLRPAMEAEIEAAIADGDSVGGVIECAVLGLPAGIGAPMFDGLENTLSRAVFAIPGIRGIEFGNGFEAASLRASENNDAFSVKDGRIVTETNRHGGILGGISTGMPLIFRVAVKPTPSISKPQQTVRLSTMEQTTVSVHGRHDACIALRAAVGVEAAAAIAIWDALEDANV